jgi:hypothetical protein
MKNYTKVEDGIYQSVNTAPTRKVDEERIREIIKDKNAHKDEQQRKSASPPAATVETMR